MSDAVATSVEEPITKLTLYWSPTNETDFIRERLSNLPDLINRLGYDFVFQMPSLKFTKQEPKPKKFEKYINWRGKEREREIPQEKGLDYHYYLEFNKPLTDDELKFWRIYKLGYLSREFSPNGAWRNR